jgi:hypothetical protein
MDHQLRRRASSRRGPLRQARLRRPSGHYNDHSRRYDARTVRARQRTLRVILVAVAALLVLSAVAWAGIASQSASSGGVIATFTYSGSGINTSNPHLKIVRAGQTAYDQPVSSPQCGSQPVRCGPRAFGAQQSSVRVIRLQAGAPPDVLLELFSEGANCCFIDQVFSYAPTTHTYIKAEQNFGSYGAAVARIGSAHRWRFVSGDENFKYEFTDGADSGEPIQIWGFSAHDFHNVTRSYPKLITTDAARWLKLFEHHLANGVGLIAAWAADEELLGHDKLVQTTLAAEARHGDLRDGGTGPATGKRFITELNRFLRRLGYRR